MLPFFISCYPSQHESIYNVGCPCGVTVIGLQDYMQLNRTELLSKFRKFNVYRIFIIQSRKQNLYHHSEGPGLMFMMKHGGLVVDPYPVCIFRLDCPFDTEVELAAFSLQGKHPKQIPYMKTTMSCNCNNFSVLFIRDGTNRIVVCVVLRTPQYDSDMRAWRMVLSHTQRL